MPAIETLEGVTKVSEFVYTISERVTIGANIDDLSFATIRIINTGQFRFVAGCSTTFTVCNFVEESTALALGSDNHRNSRARFANNSTTRPIFRGCVFTQSAGIGRSDWDVSPLARPTFTDFEGAPCRVEIFGTTAQFNHFTARNMLIDNLVINCRRAGGNIEFVRPPTTNKLTVKNNEDPSINRNQNRHVVYLLGSWRNNERHPVNRLTARNVACWQGNGTKVLQLNNPTDNLEKSSEFDARQGVLEVFRTYKFRVAGRGTRNLVFDLSGGGTTDNEILARDTFESLLFQYRQPAGSRTIERDNIYRRVIRHNELLESKHQFSVNYDENAPDGLDLGTVTLEPDPNWGNTGVITEISNAQELYDEVKKFLTLNPAIDIDVRKIGATIEATHDINISATHTDLVTFQAGVLFIKSTTFVDNFKLTNNKTVIIDPSTTITGSVIDNLGDSFIVDSANSIMKIYTVRENRNARLRPNFTGRNFRFTYVAGVRYYAWVTLADLEIPVTVSPTEAGENIIDFSTAGVLQRTIATINSIPRTQEDYDMLIDNLPADVKLSLGRQGSDTGGGTTDPVDLTALTTLATSTNREILNAKEQARVDLGILRRELQEIPKATDTLANINYTSLIFNPQIPNAFVQSASVETTGHINILMNTSTISEGVLVNIESPDIALANIDEEVYVKTRIKFTNENNNSLRQSANIRLALSLFDGVNQVRNVQSSEIVTLKANDSYVDVLFNLGYRASLDVSRLTMRVSVDSTTADKIRLNIDRLKVQKRVTSSFVDILEEADIDSVDDIAIDVARVAERIARIGDDVIEVKTVVDSTQTNTINTLAEVLKIEGDD